MGDIVGLHPEKARLLAGSLRDMADRLVTLRNNLAMNTQYAASELAPGGENGPAIFSRYIEFLQGAARDLDWRIHVLTSGSPPPPNFNGMITGKVGFANEDDAKSQGGIDGRNAHNIWYDPNLDLDTKFKKINELIAKGQGDPAYAAAFFQNFGANLLYILQDSVQYKDVINAQELEKARAEVGPLAQMLALTLRHGMLPEDRTKFLNASPKVLSLLLNLAPGDFPPDFLAEGARKVLEQGDHEARVLILQALSENADTCLKFLQDHTNIEWLTRSELLFGGDQRPVPLVEKILEHALVDSEPGSREQQKAFENTIKHFNNLGHPGFLGSNGIRLFDKVLVKAFKPYLNYMSFEGLRLTGKVDRNAESPKPRLDISPEELQKFLGMVISNRAAREAFKTMISMYARQHNPLASIDQDKNRKQIGGLLSLAVLALNDSKLAVEDRKESIDMASGLIMDELIPDGPVLRLPKELIKKRLEEKLQKEIDDQNPTTLVDELVILLTKDLDNQLETSGATDAAGDKSEITNSYKAAMLDVLTQIDKSKNKK